ncbi:histidine phosphatase family protein [Modestobacter sp. VKM Ac-2979]|uniref:histidine phosphatase family protein n=1 Tax=unclassified Modestobacter TaxID=2643866 RepID=UPI0022AB587F|nr:MULTISPECIES: histidine phosphatase family protein [unclassified Modestobacter]MCZ2811649.1 histidine phosphatase family protein [Modestobacter sp. VKM Ac-2979]MCZ2843372.1 histidine phosphatase family protein [Modestobacter sp. VKM Ac-2980]
MSSSAPTGPPPDVPADLQAPFLRPDRATEVVLVRHGSAEHRVAPSPGGDGAIEGQADSPLTAAGVVQARAVARRLAPVAVDRLFVTTLQRTHQTAAPLAEALELSPEVVADLREVSLGVLEGGEFERRRRAGDTVLAEAFAAQRWDVIPGAESMDAFAQRVRRGLERVAEVTGPDATAVAVVHGGVIAELCHQVTGSERFAFIHVENASFTTLIRSSGGVWRLRSFNDTTHLVGQPDPRTAAPADLG